MKIRKTMGLSIILLIVDYLAVLIFKNFGSSFFPYYRNFSRSFLKIASFLLSFVPFTIWDLGLLGITVALIIAVIRKTRLIDMISSLILMISVLLTVSTFGWLLNHYAPPLGSYLGYDIKETSVEELFNATEYYLDKCIDLSFEMKRDDENHLIRSDSYEIGKKAGKAYDVFDEEIFKGSNSPVKTFSLIGDYLLYNGINGMFMPIGGEAAIPKNEATVNYPFSMAHEAAHRLGIASEQEANFCAFLACINNEDPYFIYSGYYNAFWYCYRALYKADSSLLSLLNPGESDVSLINIDRHDELDLYAKYSSPLRKVSDTINDCYLKSFGQTSGIASYGEVVDYLIAYYKKMG